MLRYTTVEPNTLSLLKELSANSVLQNLILVGGTSLALQLGHRKSVDLDLFGFPINLAAVKKELISRYKNQIIIENDNLDWALFVYIKSIKVDIIKYDVPWLSPVINFDGLRLASLLDIGAMKINAIMRRATKKDFWDIHRILQELTLSELIEGYNKKYPNNYILISAPQALCYFDDAEEDIDPVCLEGNGWEDIKKGIRSAVEEYLR